MEVVEVVDLMVALSVIIMTVMVSTREQPFGKNLQTVDMKNIFQTVLEAQQLQAQHMHMLQDRRSSQTL